ncbi:MAG TPA: hypothetical protein PLR07_07500 [Promineifilum sp.]|nr:hypothetical protein [Promineifilum sp.]
MINRTARAAGIIFLREVRAGQVSPKEFERTWPKGAGDLAVNSVGFWIWTLFDDDSNAPILIKPNSEEEKILTNSIEFLSSNHEFQPQQSGIARKFKTIFTNGVEWIGCELPWHMNWPFPPAIKHD